MRRTFLLILVCTIFFLRVETIWCSQPTKLDDLKKLDIICFIPSYLPDGFQLKQVEITYEDYEGLEGATITNLLHCPNYSQQYENEHQGAFIIESAQDGVGDRNLMEESNSEETEIQTSFLGPVYIIYRPKGRSGIKTEIISNWCRDENWNKEGTTNLQMPVHILGRVHGFTGKTMDLEEFEKIIRSLHPIRNSNNNPNTK